MRKLLMTADTVGGVWTYALELCRALRVHDISVTLATMGAPPNAAQWREVAALPHVTVESSAFKLEWMTAPWDDLQRAGDWLLDLAVRDGADLVHLNAYGHAALAWPVPALVVGHSDVLSWFRAVRGVEAPSGWDRYRTEVGAGLRAAAHVVAPTQAMLRSLQADYGPFRRASVIANARDPSRFAPGSKQELIVSIGRLWDDAKNLATLDAAAASLPWPVQVAGALDSPDGSCRTGQCVEWLGSLASDEVAALLARASIYALPARYEPFGLSVLEAALSGCALVLGDIPSLREQWEGAAIFVAPDDVDALVVAVDALVGAPDWRRELQSDARARAETLTPGRMADSYLALYRDLVAHPEDVACA